MYAWAPPPGIPLSVLKLIRHDLVSLLHGLVLDMDKSNQTSPTDSLSSNSPPFVQEDRHHAQGVAVLDGWM